MGSRDVSRVSNLSLPLPIHPPYPDPEYILHHAMMARELSRVVVSYRELPAEHSTFLDTSV